eukprot:3361186-Prorocentrum_lima.AAC.1
MTSSLVGSEMCIRDRARPLPWSAAPPFPQAAPPSRSQFANHSPPSVSYTHLTLPTSVDLGGR